MQFTAQRPLDRLDLPHSTVAGEVEQGMSVVPILRTRNHLIQPPTVEADVEGRGAPGVPGHDGHTTE